MTQPACFIAGARDPVRAFIPGMDLYAACGERALAEASDRGLRVIAYATAAEFVAAARAVRGRTLLRQATWGLARRMPDLSASRWMTAPQIAIVLTVAAMALLAFALLPWEVNWVILSAIGAILFLSVVALRLLALFPRLPDHEPEPPPIADWKLPVYTVLVPLFRETSVLRQLIGALSSLDYPPERLDIKLILEESDILMQRALAAVRLPPQFEIIVVPAGRPQTKPRALNYALHFAKGELLTIYDAEDIPHPGQLRQAAERFAASSPDLACLQAELAFYNPNESWLTRQFTIEYAVLFTMLLPALAQHRLPLPLGGTSNHFRAAALRDAGAWDAFNVTEDADLGVRLARFGYDTATLDCQTLEEANSRFGNWHRQRARWLKGFLFTWLVHMRHPLRLWRDIGASGFWAFQALMLGVFMSALLYPFCLGLTLALYATEPLAAPGAGWGLRGLAALNLLVFAAGYAVSFAAAARALRKRGLRGWHFILLTMPVYWLMMSAAAWTGLWQFMTAPFHWNKTEHGLSRQQHKPFA